MKHLLAIALILLLAAGAAVAADLDGTWRLVFDTEAGERVGMMDITANGSELNAKFRGEGSPEGLDV
ncbi:MAG: hypothetical protein GY953_41440, partial [bacterium]|nr:hypothetical protein [bacterium]